MRDGRTWTWLPLCPANGPDAIAGDRIRFGANSAVELDACAWAWPAVRMGSTPMPGVGDSGAGYSTAGRAGGD